MSFTASRYSDRADVRRRRHLRALVPPRPGHRRPDLRARQIGRARQLETRTLAFARRLMRRLHP